MRIEMRPAQRRESYKIHKSKSPTPSELDLKQNPSYLTVIQVDGSTNTVYQNKAPSSSIQQRTIYPDSLNATSHEMAVIP